MRSRLFIVAEIGANHFGDLAHAAKLVEEAKLAGADAVKFQTFTPEEIAVDRMIETGPWAGRSYHDLYREAMLPWEWHAPLFDFARRIGLVAFSTPFSVAAVERLESIGNPIYKIASPEIVCLDLIDAAARTHKPLIISAGMANEREIQAAETAAYLGGAYDVTFLHCVSEYPAPPEFFDLKAISDGNTYGRQTGLSDHSLGYEIAVAAVALGAKVIEKHFTLWRDDGGPDAAFSLEPAEFKRMTQACRAVERAMSGEGSGRRRNTDSPYKRSLWVTQPVKAGELLSEANVGILRPADGLHPRHLVEVLGKPAARDLPASSPLTWSAIGAEVH